MAEEFEGRDLRGAVFWGVDLRGARFRDVDMTDVVISHAMVIDMDVDAYVENVTINGVDITEYVNERDPWYPLRAQIRAGDPDGMRSAWQALEEEWDTTIEHAAQLSDAQRRESVGGEWSFVQTLRHLVFAIDKWFAAPILGESLDPMGMPNTGSIDFPWPGLDRDADPTFDEVLRVRRGRAQQLRDYLERVTPGELAVDVDILENGVNQLGDCIRVVFEEEFHHLRYARRDLALLT